MVPLAPLPPLLPANVARRVRKESAAHRPEPVVLVPGAWEGVRESRGGEPTYHSLMVVLWGLGTNWGERPASGDEPGQSGQ